MMSVDQPCAMGVPSLFAPRESATFFSKSPQRNNQSTSTSCEPTGFSQLRHVAAPEEPVSCNGIHCGHAAFDP